LFVIGILSASLAIAPDTRAQTPVIDSANLAQNIQTAAQAIVAVEQLKSQLTQLQQTYQMFTNPTDIMSMATGMENQTVENPMPGRLSGT
jgi:type IV secretion system protein VirB5